MSLIKSSYYTFISTVIKMISALVINKAVAHFVGPSGIAIIGQFQNFSQLAMVLSQGGINNGIVKYVAEYKDDAIKLRQVMSSALIITLFCTSITILTLLLFSDTAAIYFLQSVDYRSVIIIFALTLILFSINGLLISVINGLQEIKLFTKANISQSLYSLVFSSILIYFYGLKGALYALATNQSIVFVVLLVLLRKHSVINTYNFRARIDKAISHKLFKYSLMTLISAIVAPTSLLIIRNILIDKYSLNVAGQWQALWYISTMYLMVITTTLSVYYLPKLSSIKDPQLLREEILKGYKVIVPFLLGAIGIIYLLRELIISILFNDQFQEITNLFAFQLIGDFMKLSAWLLSYIMLAKAMTKAFIITEVVFSSTFVILSYLFIEKFGLVGVTYAFATNYFLYLLCMIVLFKDLILAKKFRN